MKLDEFCRARGIDLESVAAGVEAGVGLGPGDSLLAVGSLVEGIGNSKSDLDLFLVTSRPDADLPERDEVALVVGRSVVDVRILRAADVDELLGRLTQWSRLPWNLTHAAGFGIEEQKLLHRLCHGHMLWPGRGASAMPAPRRDDVARLRLHEARHVGRSIQVDLDGYVEDGEYRGLVFAAQELLGHAVDAVLAGYGFTNPLAKWRATLLGSIPADWEEPLSLRPTGLTAAERLWRLHLAPDPPAAEECVKYALEISTFARAIFVWAERRLQAPHASRDRRLTWQAGSRSDHARAPLPHLDFDVDFLLSEEGAILGRLNDFGQTVSLSGGEFDVALLCDGVTTATEADAVVRAAAGAEEARAASDVVEQLAAAGLFRERLV
jgi:hypothetical protein